MAKNKVERDRLEELRLKYKTLELTKKLQTPDDWYPNIDKIYCGASLFKSWPLDSESWFISIYGGDDYSMVKRFGNYEEALKCYKSLPNPVTQDYLYGMGFGAD